MNGHSINRYTINSKKIHKSDQKGHLTLKYRRGSTFGSEDASTLGAEVGGEVNNPHEGRGDIREIPSKDSSCGEYSQKVEIPDESSDGDMAEVELLEAGEKSSSDVDDEDRLLKELEKIRAERKELKRKRKESDIKLMLQNNPLLEDSHQAKCDNGSDSDRGEGYVLRKRWTEDTVFRGQNKANPTRKRFINDIIHSDQHKEFMKKYIL